MSDLVSVIIPVYNSSKTIIETLNSVREQNYRPIEIIIVDDGSIDSIEELISNWEIKNCNAEFSIEYSQQPNRGVSAARNAGFCAAKGSLIQFLDSDDVIHPGKISRSIIELTRTDSDIAVCQVHRFDYDDDIQKRLSQEPIFSKFSYVPVRPPYLARYRWDSHTPLYRRSVIEETGTYNETIRTTETFEWVCRCRCLGKPTCFIPYQLYFYRQNVPGSLSSLGARKTARSRLRTAWHIARTLEAYDICEPLEWRAVTVFCLQTSYRSQVVGLDRLAKINFLLARKLSRKSGVLLSMMLRIPWCIAKRVMITRYWVYNVVRRLR